MCRADFGEDMMEFEWLNLFNFIDPDTVLVNAATAKVDSESRANRDDCLRARLPTCAIFDLLRRACDGRVTYHVRGVTSALRGWLCRLWSEADLSRARSLGSTAWGRRSRHTLEYRSEIPPLAPGRAHFEHLQMTVILEGGGRQALANQTPAFDHGFQLIEFPLNYWVCRRLELGKSTDFEAVNCQPHNRLV